ncbi:hypothetical protein Ait01nite_011670 [Actinoplanes italicus]|nr:hypothetical protein Ait01nite_011670 [Actinoplanes italicus]
MAGVAGPSQCRHQGEKVPGVRGATRVGRCVHGGLPGFRSSTAYGGTPSPFLSYVAGRLRRVDDTGVVEVTASEDVFVMPEEWLERVHPRRGGAGVRPFAAEPWSRAQVDHVLAEAGDDMARMIAASTSPDVRDAEAQSPAWAAVVALTATYGRGGMAAFADVWITDHGLRFAALAAAGTATLIIDDPAARYRRNPTAGASIRHRVAADSSGRFRSSLEALLRVRAALAAAPEDEFEQVSAAVAAYRSGLPHVRAACSVLIPRPDWVSEDVAEALAADDSSRCRMLLHAVGTPAQAASLTRAVHLHHLDQDRLPITVVDGVGAGAATALFHWLDQRFQYSPGQSTADELLPVLAALPGDDVMRGLLARSGQRSVRMALQDAARRFPARALRILAEENDDLLRLHVIKHLDLVDQVMPLLSPAATGRVRAVVGSWDEVVTAPPSAVPAVLIDPPWQNRRKAAKPPVVTGLTCTDPASEDWLPGEREEWAERASSRDDSRTDWAALAEKVIGGTGQWFDAGALFSRGPEEIARPALARWHPRTDYHSPFWFPIAAARFGTDALPALLTLARSTPADYGPSLMPFTSPEVATLMADWAARLKSVRRLAQQWLLRHPAAAARALIPAALGKAGTARRQAERALLLLHERGHTGQLRTAAAGYGPEAAAGLEALFSADPLAALPARMPSPPEWAAPAVLPPVRLCDGSGALPAEAVANLVRMLMISRFDEPYAGLGPVRRAVDAAGLAEFGWALFEMWQATGGIAKDGWVLDAVALTGDDETVRRITPLITSWPTEGWTAKAVTALSVLVGIGTDEAFLHLHRISQRAKSGPLRKAAAARLTDIAESLGLTADQLADRLVPDFGLDADGSLRLDFGARQFMVGFDEQLRPFVTDGGGRRVKALPKPGARDDAELGEAAYQRFSALKRGVRKVAVEQVRRLEQAMVAGRRWTPAEFRRLFVEHPLMWHIGRRLVWVRHDESGAVAGTLRIAEDRSFADADDEPVEIGADETLGVAHPLQMADDLARWAGVFGDYEILQPFPQLGRPVYAFSDPERTAGRIERFEGVTVATTKVLTLDRRGWRRQEAVKAGIQPGFDRVIDAGQVLTVHLDPGIVGQVGFDPQQKLVAVFLHDGSASAWSLTEADTLPLSSLDPIIASEILRDLTDVTG